MNKGWIEQQAELCANVAAYNRIAPERQDETVPLDAQVIAAALNQFQECVRYLNTRRSRGAVLNLTSEADVQDALYLMLRPWIPDLTSENPTDRISNRYTIKDFLCPSAKTVIEAKYVRDASHGKNISKEMHDDIEVYRHHPKCKLSLIHI